jgi:hypothetical protein
MRGRLVHLDDARFELLFEACRLHTDGHTEANPPSGQPAAMPERTGAEALAPR